MPIRIRGKMAYGVPSSLSQRDFPCHPAREAQQEAEQGRGPVSRHGQIYDYQRTEDQRRYSPCRQSHSTQDGREIVPERGRVVGAESRTGQGCKHTLDVCPGQEQEEGGYQEQEQPMYAQEVVQWRLPFADLKARGEGVIVQVEGKEG